MNEFIEEYLHRLQKVERDEQVVELYRWFWERKDEVRTTSTHINMLLSLQGDSRLQPDLPCLTVGSTSGLLILSANPGWDRKTNAKEDAYCRKSEEHYIDLMRNFFGLYPSVVDKRIRWWSGPFWFVRLLKGGVERFGAASSSEEKWRRAYESRLVGGWELFPFHSHSDGITQHSSKINWLCACTKESISAAIRLEPEVLFIASKAGYEILKQSYPRLRWKDGSVKNGNRNVKVSYCVVEKTEIVAIAYQVFSAPRVFKNREVLDIVDALRAKF